jgi:hypothetical protein
MTCSPLAFLLLASRVLVVSVRPLLAGLTRAGYEAWGSVPLRDKDVTCKFHHDRGNATVLYFS